MQTVYEFRKGDHVMLTDYTNFSDHYKHNGQIGVIHSVRLVGMKYGITWADGSTSSAYAETVIPAGGANE